MTFHLKIYIDILIGLITVFQIQTKRIFRQITAPSKICNKPKDKISL